MKNAILLPGLDGTGELFGPFVNAAPPDIQIVVVEYPVDEGSMDALEQHARSKLVNRCIVIAESFSGPIGVRLSMDPRVRALILCNSFVTNPFALSLRHLAVAPLFAIPLPGFFLRSVLLGRYASSTLLQTAQRAIRRVPSRVVAQRVQEVFRADERAAFRALQKPVFYLRGSEDYLISERSWKRLKEIRPDASIANIKGPHMLLQTFPRECWDAISRFIETGIF